MNQGALPQVSKSQLPWWTWVAPFFVIELGDLVSLLFRYSQTYSAFYLPTAIGIVLVQWWGPKRVLPSFFIIATLNSWYYGIQTIWLWFAFGIVETSIVFLSWYLFRKLAKGDFSLPDTRNTLSFLGYGIFIPISIEVAIWELFYYLDGMFPLQQYWERFSRDILSELIVNLSVGLPALYMITPFMNKLGLLQNPLLTTVLIRVRLSKIGVEVILIIIILILLFFFIPFEKFWFVYGLSSFYLAIRFGFGMALVGNAILFFISYILPILLNFFSSSANFYVEMEMINTYLGTLLLYVFAIVTGRVISDLKSIRMKLNEQNAELSETNLELDRFVYSVSHDLTAPLKSVLGLVNISKLTTNTQEHNLYFEKIGASVSRLDLFIKEVLDYSQNKRLVLQKENVQVREICEEILDNLKYHDSYGKLVVDFDGLRCETVVTDRARLKIIMNNLLTNAVKYQKKNASHEPVIRISSNRSGETILLHIEDNGEGIRPDVLPNIFSMFFRGHENSMGSGLGLYIAKEAAEKLGATISVTSEYGKGSVFTIKINEQ